MAGVPYIFGNATTSIPLSQLDNNFATPVTIGSTSVGLGNTTNSLANVTIATPTINTAASVGGAWTAAATWTLPAFTLSGTISGNGQVISNTGNILAGASTVGAANGGIQLQIAGNGAGIPILVSSGNSTSSGDITNAVYSTAASQYQFYVTYDGVVHARNTSIAALSDERVKTNIRPLDVGVSEVMQIDFCMFDRTDGIERDQMGLIAQKTLSIPKLGERLVCKTWISTSDKTDNQYLGLRYGDLIPAYGRSIQQIVAALEAHGISVQ
jgi:hypothetical protein